MPAWRSGWEPISPAAGTRTGGRLEALVAAHPLRERLRGQLMLALYRGGRQAEALDAYQRARSTLVDELGIEPRPELQELNRKILTQEVLAAPSPQSEAKRTNPTNCRVRRRRSWVGGGISTRSSRCSEVRRSQTAHADRARRER